MVRVSPKKIDGRSFAAVVKMDRGWDSGYGRGSGGTSRSVRGTRRYGGPAPYNKLEQTDRGEPFGKGRAFQEQDQEGFRGYGLGSDPPPPPQNNNKRHFDERYRMEREEQNLWLS